ncbi:unnamed protein product [Brassica oleracea var. botrytis]
MRSMGTRDSTPRLILWLCLGLLILVVGFVQCGVTYDRKALLINGQRRILFSGSIHYPRSTPDMWEGLIQKAKDGGVDVIETYVFWNLHEPSPGKYDFDGRNDLVRFVKTVHKAGLYAHLRIGPYVCAEWNFGGFPVWLKYVPGISFRTDNEPFKKAMQGFTERIVELMKSENLYESQGGPIILSQIENEYGRQGQLLGAEGHNYMTWAAKMAIATETGVPWVMCKEDDAPDPVINTCNGFYCDSFSPNKPYKPTIWTEAWSGWFTEFGGPMHHRPVQDLAFAVARFIQKGGSFVNYYMYHGGTNFGRTAGGPFVTTSYDYDAPIDEYGLIRQPKYGHLKELHKAIKMCEKTLVSTDPVVTSLGNKQQAHVYSSESGDCSAFLANYDTESASRVLFNNVHYNLPPWSISILPDCRNAVFNTAKVGVQTSQMEMLPTNTANFQWQSYLEDLSSLDDSSTFTTQGLLEQINVTRDTSDYLWYMTSVDIGETESFLHGGELPTLIIQSTGHAVHIFVNGQLSGSAFGTRENRRFTYRGKINLHSGTNKIALLSVAVGLPNVGGHFESWNTGILGPVALHGFLSQGKRDLSWQKWTYQVELRGEAMNLAYPTNTLSIGWMDTSLTVQKPQPLTWHKTYFDAPEGDEPLALDMEGMGKGQIWVNGESIGRYWTAFATGDCDHCSYTGTYKPNKCLSGCGQPTQRYYHVPRSWLKPSQNLLFLNHHHPNIKNWHLESYGKGQTFHRPKVHLKWSPGQAISAIKFASFGTPLGKCGRYQQGECHAATSYVILERVHLTQGDHDGRAMIVSWVTPLNLAGTNVVTYWIAGNSSDVKPAKKKAHGSTSSYRFYDYTSGFLHHATIKGLEYDTKYIYEVGTAKSVRQFHFTTPPKVGPDVPYTFGIIGDLGQTYASNETLYHYMSNPKGQAVLFAGDLSYADDQPNHDQRKWDTWGRFMEPCAAYQPFIFAAGNHEIDFAPEIGEPHAFKPYMHRYPNSYKSSGSISPLWYSVRRGPAHIIILSSYSAYGKYTPQYLWLEQELKNVNREQTPWLIVIVHSPWYNSNNYHYMEGESMRIAFESWLVNSKVDLVLAGHVHAYERSERFSNIKYNITNGLSTPVKDLNAPMYITIGDGGNIEGIANSYTDPQPSYSAYREASFGHALLEIKNKTHALYTWHRNQDNEPVAADSIMLYNRYNLQTDE